MENPSRVQFPTPIPGGSEKEGMSKVNKSQRAMRGGTSEGWALACSGPALEVDYEVKGQEGQFPQHGHPTTAMALAG